MGNMPVQELAEAAFEREGVRQATLDLVRPALVRFRVQAGHVAVGPVGAVRDAGGLQGQDGGSRGKDRRSKITRRSFIGAAAAGPAPARRRPGGRRVAVLMRR